MIKLRSILGFNLTRYRKKLQIRQEEKVQFAESAAISTKLLADEANVSVVMPEPEIMYIFD